MESPLRDLRRHSLPHHPMALLTRPRNPTPCMVIPPLQVIQGNHSREAWLRAPRWVPSNDFQMVDRHIGLLPWPHPLNHRVTLNSLRQVLWAILVGLPV